MKTIEKWQWIVTDEYNRQFLTEYFLTEESANKNHLTLMQNVLRQNGLEL